MALGKTITYTPFQETSFGYGSGEIASAHSTEFPNATDIVKVVIGFSTGTHWDYTTGHIATPSVGTAVSTFNKFNMEWIVRGERDDVDAVLAKLKFFPSDYEETRIWTPDLLKDNRTDGVYPVGEQPPSIPDTQMNLRVYDSNDSLVQSHTIDWEATGYEYDNNRPYWSVEPSVQDVSALGIPPLIDLGTINHVPKTDNVTVTCEFRNYDATTSHTGSAYGSFTNQSRFYVGDKKEGTRDIVERRFNFTGSLVEAQAFLDNIGYQRPLTEQTFDMVLRVTDGAVGSEVTKTCWFSDYPFEPTLPIPDLVGTEETTLIGLNVPENWDINYPVEVKEFWYTIQFDSVGTDGIDTITELGGANSAGTLDSNGLFTSNPKSSPYYLRTLRLDRVEFNFRDDFNDDFTFDIQFHARNSTLGTSYSSTPQTVNVTMTNATEFSNLYTSHDYEEDKRYRFAIDGMGLPNIAHGYNRDYTARIVVSDPNAVETIWCSDSAYTHDQDFFWENGNQLRMVGTRDQINQMLYSVYFEPATDYDQNFTFSYYQTRLSGDTTSDEAEGDFYNVEIGANNCISMTCAVSHDEYSFTPSHQDWEEDISKSFDTGIRVTDLSDEHEYTASYGTTYTVYMKMLDMYGNNYNVGSLTSTSTGGAIGSTAGLNPKSYTGTKAQVNQAIANMKYVPSADITDQFWLQFKIVRDFDGAVLADYSDTRQIQFNTASGHDEFSVTQPLYEWNEDVSFGFVSGLVITDLSDENPDMASYQTDYRVTLVAKDNSTNQVIQEITINAMSYGSATLGGAGYTLEVTGNKTDVNTALANIKIIPDPDYVNDSFRLEARIERLFDNVLLMNYSPHVATLKIKDIADYIIQTVLVNVDWEEDTPTDFRSGLVITDKATLNADYANLYGTEYRVRLRVMYNDGINNVPLPNVTITSVANNSATISGIGSSVDPLIIIGTFYDINTALDNLRMTPEKDWTSSPAADGSFFIQAGVVRLADSKVIMNDSLWNYTETTRIFNAGQEVPEYNHIWADLLYTEDLPEQYIFSDITAITDGAGDNYPNITYDVTITMDAPVSVGYWHQDQYVDDNYVDSDYINDFNSQYQYMFDDYVDDDYVEPYLRSIKLTGTRSEVNTKIQNIRFTPFRDIDDSFDILYSQDRYEDGVLDTTQTTNFHVGTVTPINGEEVAYGTTNGNKQYFVDSSAEQTGTGVMNPRYFTESWNKIYDAPLRVTDLYDEEEGESQYRITFSPANGVTLYDNTDTVIPNNVIDWASRTVVNEKISDGIKVEGAGTSDFYLNFYVTRRTFSGVEAVIFNGYLPYVYLSGPSNAVRQTFRKQSNWQSIISTSDFITDNDTLHAVDSANYVSGEEVYFQVHSNDWIPSDNVSYTDAFLPMHSDPFRIENNPSDMSYDTYSIGNIYSGDVDMFVNFDQGTSTRVHIRDAEFHMGWGVKYSINNLEFLVHHTGDLGSFVTPTDQYSFRQTGYSDSTYVYMDNTGVDFDGNTVTPDNREDVLPNNESFDRVVKDSAFTQSITYVDTSGNSTTVTSDVIGFRAYKHTNGIGYVELGYQNFPSSTMSTSPSLNFTNDENIHVAQAIADSANNDIYLVILKEKTSGVAANTTTQAIILKVNLTQGSTPSWTLIKTIDLFGLPDWWSVEAFLTDTFDRLITVQSQWSGTSWGYRNYNGSNRIRVYDKDTGGVDNWGLTTTTNFSTPTDQVATKKYGKHHDVNYCDINGSDTVVTNGGKVFQKDYGGTNNWGNSMTLDLELTYTSGGTVYNVDTLIPKFTQDYLVVGEGTDHPTQTRTRRCAISIFDKTTLQRLTSGFRVGDYEFLSSTLRMLEASRKNNTVGIFRLRENYIGLIPDQTATYVEMSLLQLTT
jgi:hypothetical protein